MASPRISVIIPVFNEVKLLRRALASIARQTLKPQEILICDDGSTDRSTSPYLQSLGSSYKGIPLVTMRQKHAGPGAARNRCITMAKGEFIAFLDADDWWLPTKLARSMAILKKSKATFVGHDFYITTGPGTYTHWRGTMLSKRRDWLSGGYPRTRYFHRRFIGLHTVVIRKEALINAGGFDADQRYGLDWEAWHAVLAANKGAKFILFKEPLAVYTLKPSRKGLTRLRQLENFLPRYVKEVAEIGRVPWQLLLLRAWYTLQAETLGQLLAQGRWSKAAHLVLRAPLAISRLISQAAFSTYTRPNFLARIVVPSNGPKQQKEHNKKARHGRTR